ncbi:class I SAM-dependent methyltransferase [Loktanella fryxellensis]|nr:class I SAM-dependent methyltransferase [Loktanella fryxellensis]
MREIRTHAELMDANYRLQRLIYDVTRRYYLLGRDTMVADLAVPPGGHVLEVACGTGRNLALIAKAYPGARLYGLDISREMLRTATARIGTQAVLKQADACDFDGRTLFGVYGFDRIVLSYSLSMIPDWAGALRVAAAHLRPGGELHVVDFGDQSALPDWFRTLLRGWLARFHVTPRTHLEPRMRALANEHGLSLQFRRLYRDYAVYAVLRSPEDRGAAHS